MAIPNKSTGRTAQVPKIVKIPAFLIGIGEIINAIADFAGVNRPLAGPGVRINESQQGAVITLDPQMLAMLADYLNSKNGNGGAAGAGGGTNVIGGVNNGGTGLPDTGTDEDGDPTTPRGDKLAWQTIKICVEISGEFTPMSMDIYAGSPY